MPPIDIHLKNSRERTGKDYRELHDWIDDKANAAEPHDISKTFENTRYVHEKWGEEAVNEFLLHIKEDIEHRLKENLQYFGLFK